MINQPFSSLWIKTITVIVFYFHSAFHIYSQIPPCVLNEVEVTAKFEGSVSSYYSAYTSCEITSPSNAVWLGSNGKFTYTLQFSKEILELSLILTATGFPKDEDFEFTNENAELPVISIVQSCDTKIIANKILSGANSTSEGGGGIFKISSEKAFKTLTIKGNGGENGSILALESLVEKPNAEEQRLKELKVLLDFNSVEYKPVNLVFVLDVSNSMAQSDKINLLKSSVSSVLSILRLEDKISMVTYAAEANVILPSTNCVDKENIEKKVKELKANGSTSGTAGIKIAYKIAEKNYISNATNLLIVVTDGAFSNYSGNYLKLIKKYQKRKIQFSVVGIKNATKDEANMREAAHLGNGVFIPITKNIDCQKNLILAVKKFAFRTVNEDIIPKLIIK